MPDADAAAPSFLILHGIDNEQPPGHWHHWLASRLRDRGLAVAYPAMPEPYAPDPDRWREHALAQLADLPEPRVVVCHSLGCLTWIRMAASDRSPRVGRVLLVSPPHDECLPDNGAAFALGDVDTAAVRAPTAGPARVVCGAEDPYCPGGPPPWAEAIGAEVDLLPGVGHVTPDDGHGPWPSCERWCLDPRVRIEA